jgi:trehalose-6-phosphatase
VNRNEVRAIRGHDVLELLPNVECTRGAALRMVRERVQEVEHVPVFTVYLGEDLTEDTAITAAREYGVAAVVGRRGRADGHLTSMGDVDALIAELLQQRVGEVARRGNVHESLS